MLAATAASRVYRAVAVPRIRVIAAWTASLAAVTAMMFEILASVVLAGSVGNNSVGVPPSRSVFEWWSWLFHYTPSLVRYAYPPGVVMLALIVAVICIGRLMLDRLQALRKAGLRVRRRGSDEQRRLGQALSDLGFAKSLFRARGRRGLLVAFELAELVVVAMSAYTLIARQATFDEAGKLTTTGDLTAGFGPKLCLVVGLVAMAAGLLAWPWSREQDVLVQLDGTLHTDGRTPVP